MNENQVFDVTKFFQTKLSQYQEKAFQWLMEREHSDNLPPFWKQTECGFINQLTNSQTERRPQSVHGGIFNDENDFEMILPLLYLIAHDKKDCGGGKQKRTLVFVDFHELWGLRMYWDTTLELKFYISDPEEGFVTSLADIYDCDVVLMDYESWSGGDRIALESREWWRVVLSEVHPYYIQALLPPLVAVNANRRWVLTDKLFSWVSDEPTKRLDFLMSFFHLEPSSTVQCLHDEDSVGKDNLQILLAAISSLPPTIQDTQCVELSAEDLTRYNMIKEEAEVTLVKYKKVKTDRLLPVLESLIVSLRQMCSDSALCSQHLELIDFEGGSRNPQMQKLIVELKADHPECVICHLPLSNALITSCGHVFCRKCIRKALAENHRCPLCRKLLSEKTDLFSESSKEVDSESSKFSKGDSSSRRLSPKAEALIELLTESSKENPAAKCVVFSQFPEMLSYLEETLREAGFKTLSLYRVMDDKTHVILQFEALEEPFVLLVSIWIAKKLDLRAASTVYFVEASKKKAEKRAVKCVHQNGQRKLVKVVQLITKNSIEEKILALHEKKITSSGLPSWSKARLCADKIRVYETDFILEV